LINLLELKMRELEIGLRNDQEKGISFFGIDEVNQLLIDGAKITKIIPVGAIGQENTAEDGSITIILNGFSMKVEIE
jgi:hypothetical protein